MSPRPWAERADVWLAPSTVAFALRRGWRARGAWQAQALAAPADGLAAWQTAQQLAASAGAPRGRAELLLSNRFVRLALLPDARGLRGLAERRVAARETLRAIHGDAVDGWQLALDPQGEHAVPLAAVDSAWLDAWRAGTGLRAVSVRPLLALAARQAWPLLRGRAAWLLVTEADAAVLARLDATGQWLSLRSLPLDGGDVTALLAPWLARSSLLDGLAPGSLPLLHAHWAPGLAAPAPACDGWSVEPVAWDGAAA